MDTGSAQQAEPSMLAALLFRIADGDEAAFRRVYELQVRRLTGVALRLTRDPGLARDAVHDAFLQIWRYAGRYDPEHGAAETWILSILRYRAFALTRRRWRETLGHEPDDAPDDAPDPLARLLGTLDGEALHRCLAELPPRERRLLMLAFVDGYSHSELAAHLQTPLGTIKSSIRRALADLRRCLEL